MEASVSSRESRLLVGPQVSMASVIGPIFRAVRTVPASPVDVAIVGAGAAGIAAARLCLAEGLAVSVLEARNRVGGRAVTATLGGHPVDLGAHWLHAGRQNPLVRLGLARGEPIRRGPRANPLLVDGQELGRDGRLSYGRSFERADRAIAAWAREPEDRSLAAAMPPLGRWRRPTEATLALISGRPLAEVSVKDFPSEEFGDNHFVRGGYGAYLARLAAGLPVALDGPVTRIELNGRGVRLTTRGGAVDARAAIVTVPLSLLAAGSIRFDPALPGDLDDAIGAFLPGIYEHVVLNWPQAPFRGADRLAKIVSRRESLGMLTRIDGSPFHYLELDHATVAAHRGQPAALAAFARSFLTEQFGARARLGLRILAVTDWMADPWSRGAWAVAPPGAACARDVLGQPVANRLWFAGEANSRAMWGTVGGAWSAGEAAAVEVAAVLGSRR